MPILGAPILVGDTVQVTLHSWSQPLIQAGLNIIHYQCTALEGDGAGTIDAAENFMEFFAVPYANALCVQAAFYGVEVKIILPDESAPGFSTTPGHVGTRGVQILPGQVAGLISKKTIEPGPGGRGRLYIPFPSEEDSLGGQPIPGYVTALQAIAFELIQIRTPESETFANNVTLQPVLFHPARPLAIPPVPPSVTPISQLLPRPRWATQRSRGSYGARNPQPFFPAPVPVP